MENKLEVKNKENRKANAWKMAMETILIIVLAAAVAGAGIVLSYIISAPKINTDDFIKKLALTSNIYDKDGSIVEGCDTA